MKNLIMLSDILLLGCCTRPLCSLKSCDINSFYPSPPLLLDERTDQ